MSPALKRVRAGLLAGALMAAGLGLGACDRLSGLGSAPAFKATDLTGADYGKSLDLTDHTGRARTLGDFKGKLVVLFFGYTQCPDVCPTTLATMAEAMKQLGADADRVQVLFVTLDPQRDTPKVLSGYVTAFDPRFIGLSGDEAATTRAAREFKVFSQKVTGSAPGQYTLDHTAATYVLDGQGRLRLYMRHGQSAADVVTDLRLLLSQG